MTQNTNEQKKSQKETDRLKEVFLNRAEIERADAIFCEHCFERSIFTMKDNERELSMGLITVLECLQCAIVGGMLPKLPSDWCEDSADCLYISLSEDMAYHECMELNDRHWTERPLPDEVKNAIRERKCKKPLKDIELIRSFGDYDFCPHCLNPIEITGVYTHSLSRPQKIMAQLKKYASFIGKNRKNKVQTINHTAEK